VVKRAEQNSLSRRMRALSPMIFIAICFLAGCASKQGGGDGSARPRTLGDSRHVITVVAEAKYYLSQVPPGMVYAEMYGDESAVGVYGNTNIDGVVLEIVEPTEYAGKIYTLRDRYRGHQANRTFALGSLYEFRASVADIGKFSFGAGPPHRLRKLSLEEAKTRLEQKAGPRTDDLEWLVGRWRCVTREWLTSWEGPLSSAGEDALDYFNVYFPYADDHLSLQLTDNPFDRPIAAEFLARHIRSVSPSDPFEERLVPMEPGPVRISKDLILAGYPFESVAFRYTRREGRSGPLLVLESRLMRLEFYKLSADLGDIKQSSVLAPIRNYSPAQIAELKKRYEEMVRAHHEETKGDGPRTTNGNSAQRSKPGIDSQSVNP
jgi:hypothetical protein